MRTTLAAVTALAGSLLLPCLMLGSAQAIDVITTPWHMKSLWRMMFGAVRDGFPTSLNLLPPSARPTQSTLIVTMPMGLRWGLLWHFGVKSKLPKIVQVRHHDAHAASFFVSPFEEATVLVMDGYATKRPNQSMSATEIALSASRKLRSSNRSACCTPL